MTKTTISSMRGSPLPNLEVHGFARKMKEAKKLIDEQARLRQRVSELGAERMALEEEIKKREHERTAEWGRAMRSGGEAPSDEAIGKAKERLEEVSKEIAAVRHAGDLSDGELKQTVAEHAAAWDREVQARGERLLREAEEIAESLTAKLGETESLAALHGWLASGGQFYTPPTPAAISIDSLLHERRRELGLLDVGVIG